MIDGLICGHLHGKPAEKVDRHGKTFAVARVQVVNGNGESLTVGAIAFADAAVVALLALEDNDSVALAGELTVKTYTAKDGEVRAAIDMLAHAVLTPYHVGRKRKAVRGGDAPPFNDDLPGAA